MLSIILRVLLLPTRILRSIPRVLRRGLRRGPHRAAADAAASRIAQPLHDRGPPAEENQSAHERFRSDAEQRREGGERPSSDTQTESNARSVTHPDDQSDQSDACAAPDAAEQADEETSGAGAASAEPPPPAAPQPQEPSSPQNSAATPEPGSCAACGEPSAEQAAGSDAEGEDMDLSAERTPKYLFFKQVPRLSLIEPSAAELTLEEARRQVDESRRFWSLNLNLFTRGDIFYEEVEEEYLCAILGDHGRSIDSRFIGMMRAFRRTMNDNTRLLYLVYAPALLLTLLLAGLAIFAVAPPGDGETTSIWPKFSDLVELGGLSGVGLVLLAVMTALLVIYKWPYDVVQQRNLLRLDNYVSNKFARVNQNFQVAKRHALNVERNRRFGEREELKEEAATWTLSYHWLSIRLLFCDFMIRNTMFQIRRNTTLYGLSGVILSLALAAGLLYGATILDNRSALQISLKEVIYLAIGAVAFILFAYGIVTRNAFNVVRDTLETNQWSRFHCTDLAGAIAEHVGEDKVQIITFRDRNRMEM